MGCRRPRRFAVVTDARRREFAYTVYDGIDDDGLPVRATEPALVPRDELDAVLAELGAERRDALAVPAAMVALAAARALAAGRVLATVRTALPALARRDAARRAEARDAGAEGRA